MLSAHLTRSLAGEPGPDDWRWHIADDAVDVLAACPTLGPLLPPGRYRPFEVVDSITAPAAHNALAAFVTTVVDTSCFATIPLGRAVGGRALLVGGNADEPGQAVGFTVPIESSGPATFGTDFLPFVSLGTVERDRHGRVRDRAWLTDPLELLGVPAAADEDRDGRLVERVLPQDLGLVTAMFSARVGGAMRVRVRAANGDPHVLYWRFARSPLDDGGHRDDIVVIDTTSPRAVPRYAAPLDELTERQLEILQLLCAGVGTREIADQLELSQPTVRNHVARILPRLEVRTRAAAVALALRAGLPAAELRVPAL
jgi:DNA-binding CsgD family transcriptional regulator